MSQGRFLDYGGQYAPETMMAALEELETAYEHFSQDPDFRRELTDTCFATKPQARNTTKSSTRAKCRLKTAKTAYTR